MSVGDVSLVSILEISFWEIVLSYWAPIPNDGPDSLWHRRGLQLASLKAYL